MKTRDFVFISLWFYIGWFGCVYFATQANDSCSLLFPFILLVFLGFKKQITFHFLKIFVLTSFIGIIFDAFLIHFKWISVRGQSGFLIPTWLISLWFLFSLSMLKIGTRFKVPFSIVAFLGMVMGPLSYKSGELFQILTFTSPFTIFIYGIFWLFFFPFVIYSSRRFS